MRIMSGDLSQVSPRLGQSAAGCLAAHAAEEGHTRAALVHAGVAVEVLTYIKTENDVSTEKLSYRNLSGVMHGPNSCWKLTSSLIDICKSNLNTAWEKLVKRRLCSLRFHRISGKVSISSSGVKIWTILMESFWPRLL